MKDVNIWSDSVFYLANATACEWHCLCSYAETKDPDFLELAKQVRTFRSKILDKLTKGKSQSYCIGKHLLSCNMALKELSNRFQESGDRELSEECLNESQLYENIFIELNGGET